MMYKSWLYLVQSFCIQLNNAHDKLLPPWIVCAAKFLYPVSTVAGVKVLPPGICMVGMDIASSKNHAGYCVKIFRQRINQPFVSASRFLTCTALSTYTALSFEDIYRTPSTSQITLSSFSKT